MPPTSSTDVAHPLFRLPPPALSLAFYNRPSTAEGAYAHLRAALAVPSAKNIFNAEADVRAHDVIEVRRSMSGTERTDTDPVVSSLGLYCFVCGERNGQGSCSWTTSEERWSGETALHPMQGRELRYTIPAVGDVGTAYACVFMLGSAKTPEDNALSQAFVAKNVPRHSGNDIGDASRFIYSTTYPAGTLVNREEQVSSSSVTVDRIERRTELLNSEAAREEVEREKRRKRASIGIIIGAVLAAILFSFVLWKRCPSCRQGSDSSDRLSDLELRHGTERGPREREAQEDDEQDVEKPPPAYHEVVTRQERIAVRYEMQRMNAPVPDYTPAVPTTVS